jgi:hypothetical protein
MTPMTDDHKDPGRPTSDEPESALSAWLSLSSPRLRLNATFP